MRLAGLDGAAIFLGKAAAIAAQLALLEVVLGIGVVVLYDVEVRGIVLLVCAAVAATIGLAATGTVYGVLASGVRARETLVPLLVLPAVTPVMLGGTRAFEAALDGVPSDGWPWVQLLVAFGAAGGDRGHHGLRTTAGGGVSVRLKLLGVAAIVSLAVLAVLALAVAPEDARQGDAYRLLYLHVPAAWLAYLAFFVTAVASALWLWPRTRSTTWDLLAGASAEVGVIFTGLTLIMGSFWGRPIWGTWWEWDARVTTTAVLFFLYLGYLALRRTGATAAERGKRCAIAAIIAFVDVPIVHFSVTWWETLHQDATVFNPDLDVQFEGFWMPFTLVCERVRVHVVVRVPGVGAHAAGRARRRP